MTDWFYDVGDIGSFSELADVGVAMPQTLAVAPLDQRPQVPGARAVDPNSAEVPLLITLIDRTNPGPPVAVLDQCKQPQWQDTLSEAGAASIVMDSADLDVDLIHQHSLIMYELYGSAVFTMLPRTLERITVPTNEEAGSLTTVSGPGNLAVLEEAVVYPSRGPGVWPIEEDRLFSWPAPDYDDRWWGNAWAMARWEDPTYWTTDAVAGSPPAPEGWPDRFCEWIWAPGTDWRIAPGGPCYARATFVVPDGIKAVHIYYAFDQTGTLYLDGQEVGTNTWALESWKASEEIMAVTPGTHTIACFCQNDYLAPDDPGTQNPGGMLVTVMGSTPAGDVGQDGGPGSDPLLQTSSAWKFLPYPDQPPGMTPGEVMIKCLNEARNRGSLGYVRPAFDMQTDSAGYAWPIVGDIATKVGYDLLTFFRELAGTYIDIAMAPGCLDLYAWALGDRGEESGVSFVSPTNPADPRTGNLGQLNHKRVL